MYQFNALVQAPGVPLETTFAGVSVQVTVGGTASDALLLFVSGGQLAPM